MENLNVILFVSRNKDNKELENFKERRKAFLTDLDPENEKLQKSFQHFVEDGLEGEFCRFYVSVNKRDPKKVYKSLLHWLIDNDDAKLYNLEAKVAGLAAEKPCAAEKKWLFDFDSTDKEMLNKFIEKVKTIDPGVTIDVHETRNGYALISNRGFDTRNLGIKQEDGTEGEFSFVELKRDDLLLIQWKRKEKIWK